MKLEVDRHMYQIRVLRTLFQIIMFRVQSFISVPKLPACCNCLKIFASYVIPDNSKAIAYASYMGANYQASGGHFVINSVWQ